MLMDLILLMNLIMLMDLILLMNLILLVDLILQTSYFKGGVNLISHIFSYNSI